jgi:hypothetical protein
MYALVTVRRDFSGLVEKLSSPAGQRISTLLTPDVPQRPMAGDISFPARRNHRSQFEVTTPTQVIARGTGGGNLLSPSLPLSLSFSIVPINNQPIRNHHQNHVQTQHHNHLHPHQLILK